MRNKATPQYRSAGMSKEAIQISLADHLVYSSSKYHPEATAYDWFHVTAMAVRDPQAIRRWLGSKPEVVVPVFDAAGKALAERAVEAVAKLGGRARVWENPPTDTYVIAYVVKETDRPANERVERGASVGKVQFRNGKEHVNNNIYCSPVPGWRFGTPVLLLGTVADAANSVARDVADSGLIWSDGATRLPGGAVIEWVPQLFGRDADALVLLGADADGLAAAVATLADLPAASAPELGAAVASAYGALGGITPEKFMERFGTPLTANDLGRVIVEVARGEIAPEGNIVGVSGKGIEAL